MTCGYVCPQCEGSGVLENGEDCDYCSVKPATPKVENTDEVDEKEEEDL